jgi:hypothetical protein
VQPVSEYAKGYDEKDVCQHVGIESLRGWVGLEGPGGSGPEEKEAAKRENLNPNCISFRGSNDHFVALYNGRRIA